MPGHRITIRTDHMALIGGLGIHDVFWVVLKTVEAK